MTQENHGNSSLRFKLDDAEQRLAYDMLSKIQRKQTAFVTALVCDYLEKHNINPYLHESKDLNNIVNAYMNVRKKGNATTPLFVAPIAETVSIAKPKTQKKTTPIPPQEIPVIKNEVIVEQETILEEIEEAVEEDDVTTTDDVINDTDFANAMQSIMNFYN